MFVSSPIWFLFVLKWIIFYILKPIRPSHPLDWIRYKHALRSLKPRCYCPIFNLCAFLNAAWRNFFAIISSRISKKFRTFFQSFLMLSDIWCILSLYFFVDFIHKKDLPGEEMYATRTLIFSDMQIIKGLPETKGK